VSASGQAKTLRYTKEKTALVTPVLSLLSFDVAQDDPELVEGSKDQTLARGSTSLS
jgi:hypothetical protein